MSQRAPPARRATRLATCGPRGSEPVALHGLKDPSAGVFVALSHPDCRELQRDAERQQRAQPAGQLMVFETIQMALVAALTIWCFVDPQIPGAVAGMSI